MDKTLRIRGISERFGISARTLRYWEQTGLIESERMPENAYRYYTPETVSRIAQICVLRSLHVPIREIKDVLSDPTALKLLHTLQNCLKRIDSETKSLQTTRNALHELAMQVHLYTLGSPESQKNALSLLETLSPIIGQKPEETKMSDLKKTDVSKPENMEVRFIDLPPMTVAAAQYTGDAPEDHAQAMLEDFIEHEHLADKLPGLRILGFNNPSPANPGDSYGYEFWVTIPETLDVPAPLQKKIFAGGLYAAHAIRMGDFHEWRTFFARMMRDPEYEIEEREPAGMDGCLEEHLNVRGYLAEKRDERKIRQLDLLIPIKEKKRT